MSKNHQKTVKNFEKSSKMSKKKKGKHHQIYQKIIRNVEKLQKKNDKSILKK